MATSETKRVLFVCMGNICRSPTGEGVLRKLVAERGLEDTIEVESAGTIGYHVGELPDPRMREAASGRGYSLDSRARQFDKADFERFDLIVAMDRHNLADIRSLDTAGAHRERVRLLSDFLDESDEWPVDVPDPYYGGPAGFQKVLDMIEAASAQLLATLKPS
ncbi:MAG: phosphotyrosine protein phosphatase [Proteobacteria bacterium]|nr:MAG: phosphotyrosine protein phosphatase [Pseudomonadota bacterium]